MATSAYTAVSKFPPRARTLPPTLRRQPPLVGEDSSDIMREAGLTDAEIAALIADGTLTVPQPTAAAAE